MKKRILFIVYLVIATSFVYSQNNVLMTIGDNEITDQEFIRIYKKNNANSIDKSKSVDEYLQLFENFKLKVIEAENQKLDTNKSFINELAGYRKQLSKPYLTDKAVDQKLIKEAYTRIQSRVRASHILIMVDKKASAKDTLLAYNKAMKIRKRILAGENFSKLAVELSDDPSAKNNGGDLGYFSAFQMVYPFENAVYNLKIGEVSEPVRTKYGYHIIKLTDKKPNPGKVKVEHIMIATPPSMSKEDLTKSKNKIFEIYEKLKNGENFEDLAKQYSDDKGSGKKGGELPWFGTGRMVPEFENTAFNLKTGNYSQPIQTKFGWHIIKKISTKPLGNFDDIKDELKAKLSKDARAEQSKKQVITRLKTEYNFLIYKNALKDFYKVVDNSIFKGKWDITKAKDLNKNLYKLDNINHSQQEFAEYLSENKKTTNVTDIKSYVNMRYNEFINKKIIEYEESKLPEKYPDFKYLLKEYHDGILLFNLTDKMVWTKAVKDTSGLKKYYRENKNKYLWPQRVNATIYTVPSEYNDKARKIVEKLSKKNSSTQDILDALNKLGKNKNKNFKAKNNIYQKEENKDVDQTNWKIGIGKSTINNNLSTFVYINKIVEPTPKDYNDCKGLVTADYQNYLEKNWVSELRKKYKIKVNNDVLKSVKLKLNNK